MRDLFGRLDPRARIVSVAAVIAIVASGRPLLWYLPLVLAMTAASGARWSEFRWRWLAPAPFILLASAILAFQAGYEAGLHVLFKGLVAATLLALLASTTPLADLLWSLRKLGSPESLNLILGAMARYTTLLGEEYGRMARARDSRTVQPIGRLGFAAHGGQIATLVLRSWDRAERIHAAMQARGFTGAWPSAATRRLRAIDAAYILIVPGLFLAARWLP